MSGRNKLQKFSDILDLPNVYENFNNDNSLLTANADLQLEMKGKWNANHFKNEQPITLELACGRGEYTLALAEKYPNRNFIGIDIKGARIWKGAKKAYEDNLTNAAFLRTRIEMIERFFDKDEVAEIWITFPDPFLRKSKANRRLTSHQFLNRYRAFLRSGGLINLKTDNTPLYDFSLESFETFEHTDIAYHNDDIYASDLFIPELAFKTYYEMMHLGKGLTIKYIQARMT